MVRKYNFYISQQQLVESSSASFVRPWDLIGKAAAGVAAAHAAAHAASQRNEDEDDDDEGTDEPLNYN